MTKRLLLALALTTGLYGQTHVLSPANGGTGIANSATIKMGSANWDLSVYAGGIPTVSGGGVGAITPATYSNVAGLWSSCSGTQYLGFDGFCHTATGTTVNDFSPVSHQFITGFTAPNFSAAQPACSDLSDAGLNCTTGGLLTSAAKGIIGVSNLTTATDEFAPFGADAATFVAPGSMFLYNLGCYASVAATGTYTDANFYSANGAVTNSASDVGRAVLKNGDTGVFHETAGMPPFYIAEENRLQMAIHTIGGSTTAAPISGCTAQTTGAQPLGWDANGAAAGFGATQYFSFSDSRGSGAWSTTEIDHMLAWPADATFSNLKVWTAGAQPANGNQVVNIRVTHAGSTTSALSTTIAASGVAGIYNSGNSTGAVLAGDYVNLSTVCNSLTPNNCAGLNTVTALVTFSDGTIKGMVIFPLFGTYTVGSDRLSAAHYPAGNKTSANEGTIVTPVPATLSASKFHCSYITPPGTSSVTVLMRKNLATPGSGPTVTIPTTGSGIQQQSDLVNSVAYTQWDTWSLLNNQASGSSARLNGCTAILK